MQSLGNFPIAASFAAGILTFISPCVLPLIPAYITFITGISIKHTGTPAPAKETIDTKEKNNQPFIKQLTYENNGSHFKIFLSSLIFVLGFTTVFVLLGISATYIGSLFLDNINILKWAGGIIVIIFGLHLTGIFKIPFLYKQFSYLNLTGKKTNYFTVFFIGCAFALGWTPCVGPILSSILILASTQETVNQGAVLLVFYSLGLGIPFILTALFINKFLSVFNSVKKHYKTIEVFSGILLAGVGILIITDGFNNITMFLMKTAGK